MVLELRDRGHEVYDFRNPAPGNSGFAWSEIDRDWLQWSPEKYEALVKTHPVAAAGYMLDKAALDWCDTCVLLLPCGRSAHLEAGYTIGQGKETFVLLRHEKFEPELMYLLATDIFSETAALLQRLEAETPMAAAATGLTGSPPSALPSPPSSPSLRRRRTGGDTTTGSGMGPRNPMKSSRFWTATGIESK